MLNRAFARHGRLDQVDPELFCQCHIDMQFVINLEPLSSAFWPRFSEAFALRRQVATNAWLLWRCKAVFLHAVDRDFVARCFRSGCAQIRRLLKGFRRYSPSSASIQVVIAAFTSSLRSCMIQ